jgi:hypothetical protein
MERPRTRALEHLGRCRVTALGRLSLALLLVVLTYAAITLTATLTPAIADLTSGGPSQTGYSPYSDYERCHMDANGVLHPYYTHRTDC